MQLRPCAKCRKFNVILPCTESASNPSALYVRPSVDGRGDSMGVARKLRSGFLALAALWAAGVGSAHAIPALQLYIEGAIYDQDTASWVTNQSHLNLWVIGGTGRVGSIADVQLAAAYLTRETGTISLTPIQTTLLNDPSLPDLPVLDPTLGANGTRPRMSDGRSLPWHDTYGPGVSFKQWGLGDFTATDSPIGDFTRSFPSSFPDMGQINAYSIDITGYTTVHFDTFNHLECSSRALFGPFSHDATSAVPEPHTLLMLGLGLLGTGGLGALRRRWR
jgi:hypothetical protein